MNTARITTTSFLAYFILSAITSPLGIVSQGVATKFGVSIASATGLFSWLTLGILIGSVLAVVSVDKIALKRLILAATGITLLGLFIISQSASLSLFSLGLWLAGIGSGLAISLASVVITSAFQSKYHAPLLLFTDSSYSIAGWISAALATYLLVQNAPWWSSYSLPAFALIFVFILCLMSQYPAPNKETQEPLTSVLTLPTIACSISMFFYMLGLVVLYSWLPEVGIVTGGLELSESGLLVSALFSAMFFGQLVMVALVLIAPNRVLIIVSLLMISFLSVNLWLPVISLSLNQTVLLMGFIGGGIFKVSIAYGANILGKPSAKLVSFFLFGTALGTTIAPKLSSVFAQEFGELSTMMMVTFCYAAAFCFMLLSVLTKPTKTLYG